MKKIFTISGVFILFVFAAKGQTNFRTNGTGGGQWTTIGTWQVESPNGSGNWVAATSTPTSASNTIEILGTDAVTVAANLTIDQTTIDAGGSVKVTGGTLTLNNVASALVVNGTLSLSGGTAISSPSATALVVNGTYTHAIDGGTVPTATWNTGSTCNITGYVKTTISGINQSFYNLTWNCAGQTKASTNSLGSTTTTVNGDFSIVNTGVSSVTLGATTLTIGGSLSVGASATVISANTTINIGNSLTIDGSYTMGTETMVFSGAAATISGAKLAATTLNSITVSSGANVSTTDVLTLAGNLTNNGSFSPGFDINIQGNWVNNGTFTSGAFVHFNATKAQTVSGTADSQFFDVEINNSKGVTISSTQTVNDLLLLSSGTLTTAGFLNILNGATIKVVAGTVSATPNGGPWNLLYVNTANITTGPEIPSPGTVTSVIVSSSATVTLNSALSVGSGGFNLNSGKFTAGSFAISTSSLTTLSGTTFTAPSTTLTITSGNVSVSGTSYVNNSGTLIFAGTTSQTLSAGTSANFYSITINSGATLVAPTTLNVQGNFTNNGTFSAGTGTVNFNGTVALSTVSGSSNTSFYNLTVNKSSPATNAVTLSAAETITNNLTVTAGTLNLASTVAITGTSSQVTLTSGTLNVTGAVSVTGVSSLIKLTAGTFSVTSNKLSLASGSTVNVVGATISTSSPTGGPWNLTYTGGSLTTGFEVPTTGAGTVQSVTSSSTAGTTITLNKALTVGTGGFTVTSGTFACGANAVSSPFLTVNSGATFIEPTSTLTLTGNLTINGTYTSAGTLVFGGVSAQTISGAAATTTNFNSITVNSGATLTAPTALTVLGTLQNNGTFTAGTGTVTFSSAASAATAQISGSSSLTFYNLTVANGTAATDLINENSAGVNLTNILNAGAATFDTDGAANNRTFTLLSTGDKPSVDASIAALTSATPTSQLPGQITVQRFLSKIGVSAYNYQVWRDISAPVNSTVADLINSAKPSGLYLPVTGSFSGASTVSGASGNSLFSYAENTTTDTNGDGVVDLNDGFTGFPTSTSATAFTAGQGYSIFIFGSDPPVSTTGNAKFDLTGLANAGSISLPVSYTAARSTTVYNDGWNLVGNPYPSTIDWKAASGWTKTNINDAIYMDDYSTSNPVFASYVNGVGTNGGTQYIGTGQGFWVKANAASPVLTISESVKVAGTQTTIFRQAAPQNMLRVTLQTSDNLRDETVIYFTDSASVGFDPKYDALKLNNQYGYLNLSTLGVSQDKYAINALPPFSTCSQTVQLNVSDVTTGTYNLLFSDFATMSSSIQIQLKDNFSQTVVDARQTTSYPFNVDQNNALTYGPNRFVITFTYQPGNNSLNLSAANVCDPSTAKITVSNSSADFAYSILSLTDGSTLVGPTSGTNADLVLTVPSNLLIAGVNQYQISMVSKYCTSNVMTANASFTYSPIPTAPTAVSSTSCGQGVVTLTASGAPADGHYNWYDSLGAVTPLNTQTAIFSTPVLTKTQTYYVSSVNGLGCEGSRTSIDATVVNLTPAAITVVDLTTIQSNYASGNQWYLNGTAIAGATGATLKATQSGSYQLVVTSNGCTTTATLEFVVTADEQNLEGIKLYPNPVKGLFTIEVSHDGQPEAELLNAAGKTIAQLSFTDDGVKYFSSYNLSGESSGMYLVKIYQSNKLSVVKVIKD